MEDKISLKIRNQPLFCECNKDYKDKLSDVVLSCPDGSIYASRILLASSSTYFENIFIAHEDVPEIFLVDINIKELKALYSLLHYGSVTVGEEIKEGFLNTLKLYNIPTENTQSDDPKKKNQVHDRKANNEPTKRNACNKEAIKHCPTYIPKVSNYKPKIQPEAAVVQAKLVRAGKMSGCQYDHEKLADQGLLEDHMLLYHEARRSTRVRRQSVFYQA